MMATRLQTSTRIQQMMRRKMETTDLAQEWHFFHVCAVKKVRVLQLLWWWFIIVGGTLKSVVSWWCCLNEIWWCLLLDVSAFGVISIKDISYVQEVVMCFCFNQHVYNKSPYHSGDLLSWGLPTSQETYKKVLLCCWELLVGQEL